MMEQWEPFERQPDFEDDGQQRRAFDEDGRQPVDAEDLVGDMAERESLHATVKGKTIDQWYWAASNAGIPQVWDIQVESSDPIEHARITILLGDGERQIARQVVHEGPIRPGLTSRWGATQRDSFLLELSADYMAQVDERRPAHLEIELESVGRDGAVLLDSQSSDVDIQPRDLFVWDGDPRRAHARSMVQKYRQLIQEAEEAGVTDVALEAAAVEASRQLVSLQSGESHAMSLLASFVRPNHPVVGEVAREAGRTHLAQTGTGAFQARLINEDPAEQAKHIESSVSAVYEALSQRDISYAVSPPGWDYRGEAQRVRDHGPVANGGLGNCMDTTVLLAAVLEHIGLWPVLIMIPGHILVGYWRVDPLPSTGRPQEWYPNTPVITDWAQFRSLMALGKLGVIETTTVGAATTKITAEQAKTIAAQQINEKYGAESFRVIDVASARMSKIHPLPTFYERGDGTVEITVYQPGTPPGQTVDERSAVSPIDRGVRVVDPHPPRIRTWKASLLTLNATSPLLNLKSGPSAQPVLLEEEGLARLEDMLHQDAELEVTSGFDIPEVYAARDQPNAALIPEQDRLQFLRSRRIFVQRISTRPSASGPIPPAKFFSEMRSMARKAKSARDERGMNPLFLAIGMLRWPDKNPRGNSFYDSPIILVPIQIHVRARTKSITITIDNSSHVAPNYALIEWLKREHGLVIPELQEPTADKAGIDVSATLAAVRKAVRDAGLSFSVESEGKIALLDLAAFRMWQDLTIHADEFLENPLVKHLVHTPADSFEDPAEVDDEQADLDALLVPVPADSAQLQAVDWAGRGRTFVLQGPPGTGKSQTITNMIAHCVSRGMKVMFVAEKQTALQVVQRRLEEVGLTPFMLNLHQDGSSSAQVRAQLKRSANAKVQPDPTAMQAAERKLRQAKFQLLQYPNHLHARNAAGLSAYSARDRILALGDGPSFDVPPVTVARSAETIERAEQVLRDLQPYTAAARVRAGHPWRLAGPQALDLLPLEDVGRAINGLSQATAWLSDEGSEIARMALAAENISQLRQLVAASNPRLPSGVVLDQVLDAGWSPAARLALDDSQRTFTQWSPAVAGFDPKVLTLDLQALRQQLTASSRGNVFTRKSRGLKALEPLQLRRSDPTPLDPTTADAVLESLIGAQQADQWISSRLRSVPGIALPASWSAFTPGAIDDAAHQIRTLQQDLGPVLGNDPWASEVQDLVRRGTLTADQPRLTALAVAWESLAGCLVVQEHDERVWRQDIGLMQAACRDLPAWLDDLNHQGLVDLKRWISLANELTVFEGLGLGSVRDGLLDGSIPADGAEEYFDRGVASAALRERMTATGLDLFDPVAHDGRVKTFSRAQREARVQWKTTGPAQILEARDSSTGGLSQELGKTKRMLTTRALVRKYGRAIQNLTPVILTSPASAVDLIEPGVTDFDVVIFDEASQITVPEAIGVMGRGKAVIVVGDSKQMPPTTRVGAAPSEDLEDELEEEVLEDQESILSECETAQVPTLRLDWHYRSQDESLIAFSNQAYYEGALSSFPTPTLESDTTGVEFKKVEGQYLRAGSGSRSVTASVKAGSNTNPEEALAIMAEVRSLIDADSTRRPSLGVVTFNEQQKDLIENLLDTSDDSDIRILRDEKEMGPADVLFVKSLEQVQGDERDYVLFSVAFSKQQSARGDKSRVPLNFGRLSHLGGERRLNVAVTRARRKNIVFCSFEPEELEGEKSAYLGVKHLKEFLSFAKTGRAPTEDATGQAIRDRHRDEIAEALRARGVHVQVDVGLSDFRLDLLLSDPRDPEHPVLPVLLDGESWRGRRTVSDRDVLPVEVLENLMGWPAVARVWWPMWIQNSERALEDLLSELERVSQKAAEPADPDEPPAEAGGADQPQPQVRSYPPPSPSDRQQEPSNDTSPTPNEPRADWSPPATEPVIAPEPDQAIPAAQVVTREEEEEHPPAPAPAPAPLPAPAPAPESQLPRGLEPFIRWEGSGLPPADETSREDLASALEEIIRTEGPMKAELAYRRYHLASGRQRIGGTIRSNFNKAAAYLVRTGRVHQLKDAISGQAAKTLYIPGTPPVVVRESGGRNMTEVAPSEIHQLLVMRGMDGQLTEQVMRAVLADYERASLTKAASDFLTMCAAYEWTE